MRDFCGLGQHDRSRTVLFGRQLDRPFNDRFLQIAASDGEMEVNPRKYFGVGGRTL